ncbi:hypothetical protein JAB9_47720 [Janthinobacterium sp. HH107]|uniref:hypothetical protein n=1 Tax=Janthinobacterium sp. HH107 TaxID=1537279 RepID=UPI000874B5CD|nr:hypothetical protein [Janthinobacterium sp. HH107]OEZ92205.1 hypothetical protein JAB9_47720 [Janthinobacterium sp. HH107]
MKFGIHIENNDGGLILSAESPGLAYIGPAPFIGSADEPGSPSTAKVLGRYRISSINEPLIFIELVPGALFNVYSVTLSASNTWDILVYCSDVSGGSGAIPTARVATVHCFAPLVGPVSSGYGFWLFDAAGNCTFDLGAKMIMPRAIGEFPAATPPPDSFDLQSYAIPSMARPAICGLADGVGSRGLVNISGSGTSTELDFSGAFLFRAPSTLDRTQMCVYAEPVDIPPFALRMRYRASTVLLIDMADY